MPGEAQPLVPLVERGIRLQLIGLILSTMLALLVAPIARENRGEATLLLIVGVNFLLDGYSLRANRALLGVTESARRPWIPWVSAVSYSAGALLVVIGAGFLGPWHAAP